MADQSPAPPETEVQRIAAGCPRCGARPSFRITKRFAAILRGVLAMKGNIPAFTFQCQRRGCGAIYYIELKQLTQQPDPHTVAGVDKPSGGS